MDRYLNPFLPGAGTPPPELAGRENIVLDAQVDIKRIAAGRMSRPRMFLGLRGVGKTVLLNQIRKIAEDENQVISYVEAPEGKRLAELLYPELHKALTRLSFINTAKSAATNAFRLLRNFSAAFKVEMGDFSVSVEPEEISQATGDLETDLSDLFVQIAKTAVAAQKGWILMIDEVQYLEQRELSALIVAIHRINQRALPLLFFGAGLPQIAALAGAAKSYAERLFDYPEIGPLTKASAYEAIREPIESAGENITDDSLDLIYQQTEGYPYFLQEWGFHVWNEAKKSPISPPVVSAATERAFMSLDKGFFRVRYDQLTDSEQDYVHAMAKLGSGPYETASIAHALKGTPGKFSSVRDRAIKKGVIFSPVRGRLDFTVPKFAEFLRRTAFEEDPIANM
ncbi:ATP-binding protein [Parvularcula marina]|uniref:ATP-binding protein n=1 Tax=Parvularcula marina TaxID=2292771 RepID=UPI003514284A